MATSTDEYRPLSVRIGASLYPAGTTAETLLEKAARKGEDAAAALQSRNEDAAARLTVEAATMALDATAPERADGPLRANAVWLADTDQAPRGGDAWDSVPAWGWKVTVAGTPYGRKTRYEEHDTEQVRLLVEHDGTLPPPTPRNPGYGFWGAWKLLASDAETSPVSPETAWTAVFKVHGEGTASGEHDLGLRDVLDGKIGRKYAEELAFTNAATAHRLEAELRRMGDPLSWWGN